MKIQTSHQLYRNTMDHSCDWMAYDDATYDLGSPTGYGSTEAEAIADLMEQLEEAAA